MNLWEARRSVREQRNKVNIILKTLQRNECQELNLREIQKIFNKISREYSYHGYQHLLDFMYGNEKYDQLREEVKKWKKKYDEMIKVIEDDAFEDEDDNEAEYIADLQYVTRYPESEEYDRWYLPQQDSDVDHSPGGMYQGFDDWYDYLDACGISDHGNSS